MAWLFPTKPISFIFFICRIDKMGHTKATASSTLVDYISNADMKCVSSKWYLISIFLFAYCKEPAISYIYSNANSYAVLRFGQFELFRSDISDWNHRFSCCSRGIFFKISKLFLKFIFNFLLVAFWDGIRLLD